jgi:hypothetical protein
MKRLWQWLTTCPISPLRWEILVTGTALMNILIVMKHISVGSAVGIFEIAKLTILAALFVWAFAQRNNRLAPSHRVFSWAIFFSLASDCYLDWISGSR